MKYWVYVFVMSYKYVLEMMEMRNMCLMCSF